MRGLSLRRIPDDEPFGGVPVIRLLYTADPTMTPERVARLKKGMSPAYWAREMEIEYEALEGERYIPEYQGGRNDCRAFDVSDPNLWTIWQATDPHMRTPHGHLWIAFSREGDAVVCGEIWPSQQFKVREYAEVIKWIESDSRDKPLSFDWCRGRKLAVFKRIMDTHGKAANSDEGVDYFEAYGRYGVHFYPASKSEQSLATARDDFGDMLLPVKLVVGDKESMVPRLRVFRQCSELRDELENVRYPEGDVERPSQEKPMTYRKHLIDCALYIFADKPRWVNPRRAGDSWKPIYPATGY